ncbi:MAG: hypothetical protein AAF580_00520 [Pseudomonadota bacterium]
MANAYRCPNCGIDFPAGTAGVPQDTLAPGAADDLTGEHKDRLAAVLSAALEPMDDPAGDISTPLPSSRSAAPEPQLSNDVLDELEDALASDDDLSASVPEKVSSAAVGSTDARLGVRPERAPRKGGKGRRRDASPPLPVSAPKRAVRRNPSRELALADEAPRPVRKERPLNDALSTLVTAALVIMFAGVIVTDLRPGGRAGSVGDVDRGSNISVQMTVSADDGWVNLPQRGSVMSISGTGTIRVRLDGEVFTVPAGQVVEASPRDRQSVAVRAVRAPTTATVSFIGQ